MPTPALRVLVRVIKRPRTKQGERLVLYLDSRTAADPSVLVYSCDTDVFRVEQHEALIARSRPGSPTEMSEAREHLGHLGQTVTILKSAPRTTGDGG